MNGKLDENQKNFYLQKMQTLVKIIIDEAYNMAYLNYVESLHDSTMDIDSYTIGLISDKFKRDIYFIDAQNKNALQRSKS